VRATAPAQAPSAANRWETVYRFDDYAPGSSSIHCANIITGSRSELAGDQSVQHIPPASRSVGGPPLFNRPGGKLRDEACAQKPDS
jgi:hypothetical protein